MQMVTLGPSLQYLWHPSTVLATHHLTGITDCLWLRWSDGCQTERQPGICLYWIVNCWASVLQKQQICWHRVQCFSERACFSSSVDWMLLNCPNFCNKGLIKSIMSCISVDKFATMKSDRVLAISLQHMFYSCNQNTCIEAWGHLKMPLHQGSQLQRNLLRCIKQMVQMPHIIHPVCDLYIWSYTMFFIILVHSSFS